MMLLTLAWRNIWRNHRRSAIILSSITVGLAFIILIDGWARGILQQMLANEVGGQIAHLQVHRTGFDDNKSIQNFMPRDPSRIGTVRGEAHVRWAAERVITFGLLSSANNSSGVMLMGVVPQDESRITYIAGSVVEGGYLSGSPGEILISRKLSETLGVRLGDRVVAMASRKDGRVGSELFRIVGIYQTSRLSIDRMNAYVVLQDAQRMLATGGEIAELAATVDDLAAVPAIKSNLSAAFGPDYEVLSYLQLLPGMLAQLDLLEKSMAIFYVIIGLAMVFGIANTMLMSVFERISELGVLKAIGMSNGRIFGMIVLEAILLGLCGTLLGSALGIAIHIPLAKWGLDFSAFAEGLAAWGMGAIVYPVLEPSGPITGALIVLVVCALAAMYPAMKAARLEPMSAIRYL